MDIKLKQRLVGALVLISLGVIFIPMILHGPQHDDPRTIEIKIPPRPDYGFDSRIVPLDEQAGPLEPPPVMTATRPPAGDIGRDKSSPRGIPQPPNIPIPHTEVKVDPNKRLKPEPRKVPVKPVTAKSKPKAPVARPRKVTKTASTAPSAWVIQVGSFIARDNALKLRNRLRKKGFTAFVENIGSGANQVFRVRIGPELDRAKANRLQARLSKDMNLKGIVVSYP